MALESGPPIPEGTFFLAKMKTAIETKPEPPGPTKEFTIIVNGRERKFTEKKISYIEVVRLAFDPLDPNMIYTVTYKRGDDKKPEGRMVEGDTVTVKEGMIFNVTATRKS